MVIKVLGIAIQSIATLASNKWRQLQLLVPSAAHEASTY